MSCTNETIVCIASLNRNNATASEKIGRATGFARLQVIPDLWGPVNPCLLMAKAIA